MAVVDFGGGNLGSLIAALDRRGAKYVVSDDPAVVGAARAAIITYINPAVATLLGVGLLHERLGWGGYIAFAVILAGSWLATFPAAPARHGALDVA